MTADLLVCTRVVCRASLEAFMGIAYLERLPHFGVSRLDSAEFGRRFIGVSRKAAVIEA